MDSRAGSVDTFPMMPLTGSGPDRDRLPVMALVVANVIPLAGVAFFGWRTADVVFAYWFENLVVGVFTLGRILMSRGGLGQRVFTSLFFTVHYGAFCTVHGVILMALFAAGGGIDPPSASDWPGPLMLVGLLVEVVSSLWAQAPRETALLAMALLLSHGISFVSHVLLGPERLTLTPNRAMAAPYPRIVLLHLVVLGGAFLIAALDAPALMLVLLVVLKTAVDLTLHRRAHRGGVTAEAGDRGGTA